MRKWELRLLIVLFILLSILLYLSLINGKHDNIKMLKEQIEYLAGLRHVINVRGSIHLTKEDLPKLKGCNDALFMFLRILSLDDEHLG